MPATAVLNRCSQDVAEAMGELYFTDKKGRRVRALHPATIQRQGVLCTEWDDLRTASRSHMVLSFQQHRRRIVGECRELNTARMSWNDSHPTANRFKYPLISRWTWLNWRRGRESRLAMFLTPSSLNRRVAASERCSGVRLAQRALPPFLPTTLPNATAAGSLLSCSPSICLSRCDVPDELGKLDRVARALLAGFGHDDIIARPPTEDIAPSTASDFKLTHYPASGLKPSCSRTSLRFPHLKRLRCSRSGTSAIRGRPRASRSGIREVEGAHSRSSGRAIALAASG